jgi:hypothetical protein
MGIDDVECSTLEWVDWFNHTRLLGPIGYVPPAEFEAAHYRGLDEATGQTAQAFGPTPQMNAAPRRSEGLVSKTDDRSENSGDGSGHLVVSGAHRGKVRGEVGGDRHTVGIQAPESP